MPYGKRIRVFLREWSRKRDPVDLEGCIRVVVSSPVRPATSSPWVRPGYPVR